ncbi:KTSC domain-containing protein [Pedobacter fastidiosus]|uniref:KTSC domain-containing protein n=1 Tax=Pedobacter fastidiosus TaxID=2765361 RepID=A0ABR7KMT8_9SPHI|nr:KTSC domain-containing protein [Pedobacter fastidiosus]MBC6109397.1 KTSC domain-containing protein [Pedobacter fastidiosus]
MSSSVIDHFSYDVATKTLKITFLTGMVYLYKNVPNKTFEAMKTSISKGKYFNSMIKGNFKFKKLKFE